MYGTLKKIFAFAGSKKGLLKKSLLFSFLSGLFSAMQFAALFVVIGALVSDNRDGKFIWLSLGIMAVSLIGRIITTYFSTMEQTETGYCMVAEKRIHIGDRLRYIPMGYFNKNSIGNITAMCYTAPASRHGRLAFLRFWSQSAAVHRFSYDIAANFIFGRESHARS